MSGDVAAVNPAGVGTKCAARYRATIPARDRLVIQLRLTDTPMAALTRASIIVEAGEMSGARILARAAVEQGRPLFILDRCFRDPAARWPHAFVEQHGAIRVRDHAEVLEALRGVHRDR